VSGLVTGEGVRFVTGDVTRSIESIEENKVNNTFQPLVRVSYCVAFFHGLSINNFRSLFSLFKIVPLNVKMFCRYLWMIWHSGQTEHLRRKAKERTFAIYAVTNKNFLQNLHLSKRLNLHTRQVAHKAGAYRGFCGMKWLGVFLLPPGWDASPSQGYLQH